MVLNVTIGGHTFKLLLHSNEDTRSKFSVDYNPSNENNTNPNDVAVKLTDFNGTLYISKLVSDSSDSNHASTCNESKKSSEVEELSPIKPGGNKESKRTSILRRPQSLPESEMLDSDKEASREASIVSNIGERGEINSTHDDIQCEIGFSNRYVDFGIDSSQNQLRESIAISNYSFLDDEEDGLYNSLYKRIKSIAEKKRNNRSTRLHELCNIEDVSIKELHKVLNSNPAYSTYQDNQGRLPLHIITQNEALFMRKQKAVNGFVKALIQAFPASIVVHDDLYQIPFISAISSWVQNCHEDSRVDGFKKKSLLQNDAAELVIIPLDVKVTSIVEWALKMLSDFVQGNIDYGSKKFDTTLMTNSIRAIMNTNDQIIENFCSIPNILKTVLLIDENAIRYRVLKMPIFQCALLNRQLIGDWLVPLLLSKTMYPRAIEFFEIMSDLKVSTGLNLHLKPHLANEQEFNFMRTKMIHHISRLDGLLMSIHILPQKKLSRACSTIVVQQILDIMMTRSPVLKKIMIEISSNILLVIACDDIIGNESATPMNTPSPLIFVISLYFLFCNDFTFYKIAEDTKEFIKRYLYFWNFIDLLSVLSTLTIVCLFFITGRLPGFFISIITRILLWLRLFGCLRNINMHLATFVLALSQIFSNIRWFLLVLLFACLMFADIMRVSFIENHNCNEVDYSEPTAEADYCSGNIGPALIRTYSIIIGDDPNSYRQSPGITFYWLFFTMFTIVILLNVLIAVVTESYQQAFMERSKLFGKVRVPLLARQQFLEDMSESVRSNSSRRWCSRLVQLVFVLAFELSCIHFLNLMLSENKNNMRMESVGKIIFKAVTTIFFMLVVNVVVICDVVDKYELQTYFPMSSRFQFLTQVKRWLEIGIQHLSQYLFGIKGCETEQDVEVNEEYDGWINHVLSQTKDAIEISEHNVLSVIRNLESRLEQKGVLT